MPLHAPVLFRRYFAYLFLTSWFYGHSNELIAQTVVTVAGTGVHQTKGDGGPATCAGIIYPFAVVTDPAGNLYMTTSNCVRKVSAATGIITTVAGSDTYGDSGDGGPATAATMKFPYGLCLDKAGNLYITEFSGYRVRKVSAATGIISTIAGDGTSGSGGDGGAASSAQLSNPEGICIDGAGNIYIADFNNSRIRKINAATGIITTIGGTGSHTFSGDGGLATIAGIPYPSFVCVDGTGNVYESEVLSGQTSRIRKIDGTTGIITTIAGNSNYSYGGDGGPAVNATLMDPSSICLDGSGNLYIAEYDDSRIRKITAATGIITTVAGTGTNGYSGDGGPATSAQLNNPLGICLDPAGNLYVADNQNLVIRKIYFNGSPSSPTSGTIAISAGTATFCSGQPASFTATITNGGANPVYQWEQNGNPVGNNSASFVSTTLANGDMIDCKLTVAATGCIPAGTVTSNVVTVAVQTSVPASVAISGNPAAVCSGSPIAYTAVPTNGGATPAYQWQVNGKATGNTGTGYVLANPVDGDQVTCVMTSSETCALPANSVSNAVAVKVNPVQTPAITIQLNLTMPVCTGASLTFTALATGAGSNPGYQWFSNGSPVGSNDASYQNAQPQNGDRVECQVTAEAGAPCLTAAGALSNSIVLEVSPTPAPTLQVAASSNNICQGTSVNFLASSLNAGAAPAYTWLLNGNQVGGPSPSYTNNELTDGDRVSCQLQSGSGVCAINGDVSSNTLTMTVRDTPEIQFTPPEVDITAGQKAQLSAALTGSIQSYQWNPANLLQDATILNPLTTPLVVTTLYQLTVTGSDGCSATKDVIVKVLGKFNMPNSFTPNGDGRNDVFRIPPGTAFTLKNLSVFDRWGTKVFSTADSGEGWDGRFKGKEMPAGTYVYLVSGSDGSGSLFFKGTVILLR